MEDFTKSFQAEIDHALQDERSAVAKRNDDIELLRKENQIILGDLTTERARIKDLENELDNKVHRLSAANIEAKQLKRAHEDTVRANILIVKQIATVIDSAAHQTSHVMEASLSSETIERLGRDFPQLVNDLGKLALRCPKCSQEVAGEQGIDLSPVFFGCGHTSCLSCYEDIVSTTSECPVCRTTIGDPPAPVSNFGVIQMMASLKQFLENFRTVCASHRPVNFTYDRPTSGGKSPYPQPRSTTGGESPCPQMRPTTGCKNVAALYALRLAASKLSSSSDEDSSAEDDLVASVNLSRWPTDPADFRSTRYSYCPKDYLCFECDYYIKRKEWLRERNGWLSDPYSQKPDGPEPRARNKACEENPTNSKVVKRSSTKIPALEKAKKKMAKRPAVQEEPVPSTFKRRKEEFDETSPNAQSAALLSHEYSLDCTCLECQRRAHLNL